MSTIPSCPVCGSACATCQSNHARQQQYLREGMIAWRRRYGLSISGAARALWCEDTAWYDWEDGAPISAPWATQIEQLISSPYKAREDSDAVYR